MAQYDEKKEYNPENVYDNMRQQSYRELMNSEIQASVAKQNALKYTQNQLAQSGYANQGVAQSTNLGITNNYRNAMANAQSKYTTDMNNIAQQEYAQQVADNTVRYNNLRDLLDTAYDKNNNVDLDAYRRIMEYGGATFDKEGNADVSKMKLNDLDKESLLDQYRETIEAYNKGKTSNPNPASYTNEETNTTTNFKKGYGTNKNFDITIGDTTYEAEIGNQPQGYGERVGVSNDNLNKMYADKNVGDIWVYNNPSFSGGYISFMTKDDSNNVRMVEAVGKQSLKKNAELFVNILKKNGYNVEPYTIAGRVGTYKINGVVYSFDQNMDGSCGFIKVKNAR